MLPTMFRFTDSAKRNTIGNDLLLPVRRDRATFSQSSVPRFRNIERVARRKLLQIHAATDLASLRIPPGNQLEALKGERSGQHSIRVNDQWRVCFVWRADGAHQVEIVDYH